MQHEIFPKEIITFTQENHFSRFSKTSDAFYIILIAFLFLSLLSLPFIKVDITIQSRGIIRSSTDPVPLLVPVGGWVQDIRIRENMKVESGDTLILLSPEKINKQLNLIDTKIFQYAEYVEDLKAIISGNNLNLSSYLAKSYVIEDERKRNEFETTILGVAKEFRRMKSLFEEGVIPAAEFEKTELEYENLTRERDSYISQRLSNWNTQIFQYEAELQNLKLQKNDLEIEYSYHIIRAPEAGYIANFPGIMSGTYVFPNQSIGTLYSSDSLIAECYVSPEDIGYLTEGKEVSFRIDAYDFYQWGKATGRIIDISHQLYQVDKQEFFRIKCSMDQDYLSIKNGYKGELKNGLTLTSHFKIVRRSLFDLLFDKTENWLNPRKIKI